MSNTIIGPSGVTFPDGSIQATATAKPNVVFDGTIPYNSTTTFTIDPTRLTLFFVNEGTFAGGNQSLYLGVQYGAGSLTNSIQFFNSGVDYQVAFAGAALLHLAPGNGASLLIQPYGNNIGSAGAPSQASCLVIQF